MTFARATCDGNVVEVLDPENNVVFSDIVAIGY